MRNAIIRCAERGASGFQGGVIKIGGRQRFLQGFRRGRPKETEHQRYGQQAGKPRPSRMPESMGLCEQHRMFPVSRNVPTRTSQTFKADSQCARCNLTGDLKLQKPANNYKQAFPLKALRICSAAARAKLPEIAPEVQAHLERELRHSFKAREDFGTGIENGPARDASALLVNK